ncbi:MAG TPA: plastocyanin/azurin family copper-binding protein [Homoserinimonas sp.]|nr:plastocyanin/azurin family copper-binding protein [Homoserinimonas sp.]
MSPRNPASAARATLTGALILPALVLALTGCAGPASMTPAENGMGQSAELGVGENAVMTIGLKFMPTDITVTAGTTVTWQNGEAISHTVTSGTWGEVNETTGLRGTETPDGRFDHALAPQGQEGDSFSYTFDEPGEYLYYCQPHRTMNAKVIVLP